MKLTLATCRDLPNLIEEEQGLVDALKARGADITIADWQGDFAPFENADKVLIRTIWNYVEHPREFAAWLEKLEAANVSVSNPASLLKWNMDKHYLLDLAAKGAPLPPTFASEPEVGAVLAACAEKGLSDIVIKPVISAGSKGLSHVQEVNETSIGRALAKVSGKVLVQPFLPEITTIGETSLIFYGGEFSHAVLKTPKEGEIRCQDDFGGSVASQKVSDAVVAQARRILDYLPEAPLYARVDVILRPEGMVLMEVEAIEPELFFRMKEGSAERLAELVA